MYNGAMNNSPLTDEQWAQRLASGEAVALTELVHRYQEPLARYIRRRCFSCHSELEDILQDVFLRVFTHIHEFDSGLSFSAWIYRMTHNLMVSRIRKTAVRSVETSLDETLYPSHLFRADGPYETQEIHQLIQGIQEKMPPKLRDVFVLRFLEEKDYTEIGDILKENENTVATRIRRAREFVAQEAKQLGLEFYSEEP